MLKIWDCENFKFCWVKVRNVVGTWDEHQRSYWVSLHNRINHTTTKMNTLKEGRKHFNNNHSIVAELEHYILLLFLSIYPAMCHYFFKLAYILLNVFSRKTRIISKKIDFDNRSFFSSIKGILDNMHLHDLVFLCQTFYYMHQLFHVRNKMHIFYCMEMCNDT